MIERIVVLLYSTMDQHKVGYREVLKEINTIRFLYSNSGRGDMLMFKPNRRGGTDMAVLHGPLTIPRWPTPRARTLQKFELKTSREVRS